MTREQICTQVSHCLSCPISIRITGKDCRNLSQKEIEEYVNKVREVERKCFGSS